MSESSITGSRLEFSQISEHTRYGKGSGQYYSLLIGRAYQPHKYAILLEYDNKSEGDTQSGLDFVNELNIDQYNAPKQFTLRLITLYILCRYNRLSKSEQRHALHMKGIHKNIDVFLK